MARNIVLDREVAHRTTQRSVHDKWIQVGIALTLLTTLLIPWAVIYPHGISGDVWWQLTVGHWDLIHHQILARDLYSYTVPHQSWVDIEWGWQVVTAWLQEKIGIGAIWLVSAGVIDLAVLVVMARLRRRGANLTTVFVLSIWCTITIANLYDKARPVVVSFVIVALLFYILDRAKKENERWLWTLPPLFAIWANLHGSYLLGEVVLVVEVALSLVADHIHGERIVNPHLRTKSALLALIASFLATLATPWGIRGPIAALSLSSNHQISSHIQEWQSPNFHNFGYLVLIGIPIAWVAISLILSDRPIRMDDFVFTALLLGASLVALRMIPYYEIVWVGLAATYPLPRLKPTTWLLASTIWLTATTTLLASHLPPSSYRPAKDIPTTMVVNAARTGRLFTSYRVEDWAVTQNIPVFLDGRVYLYVSGRPSILNQYISLTQAIDPGRILNRWKIDNVVYYHPSPLVSWLRLSPNWHLVSTDGMWSWFKRTNRITKMGARSSPL